MAESSQKRALTKYRTRLTQRGVARFEVLGLDADRALIRSLAKRLTQDDPEATRLRSMVRSSLASEPPRTGSILAALRRSPLVGAEIDIARASAAGRDVDL